MKNQRKDPVKVAHVMWLRVSGSCLTPSPHCDMSYGSHLTYPLISPPLIIIIIIIIVCVVKCLLSHRPDQDLLRPSLAPLTRSDLTVTMIYDPTHIT